MSHIQKAIAYFDRPGPQNTEEVLRLAKDRAEELNIKDIVVASTKGVTGVKASELFRGFNVVVVSHFTGFKQAGVQELSDENRRKIEQNGSKILTCMHAFAGINRAIRQKFCTWVPSRNHGSNPENLWRRDKSCRRNCDDGGRCGFNTC